jgi:hypothetical protein
VLLRNAILVEAPPDVAALAKKEHEAAQEAYKRDRTEFFNSCTAERNRLIETRTDQSKTYDQTILTFSAGAIALSITFVEKIAPTPAVPVLLYVAWCFFGLAVLSVVLSFLASQRAFQLEIDAVTARWNAAVAAENAPAAEGTTADTPKPATRLANRFTAYTRYLNYSSGGLFVAGIVFFVLFGVCNWPVTKEAGKITGTPIKIEITGEVMPRTMNVVTTSGAGGDVQKAATPVPAMLAPVPQPPASAPATQTTQTGTTGTSQTTSTTTTSK